MRSKGWEFSSADVGFFTNRKRERGCRGRKFSTLKKEVGDCVSKKVNDNFKIKGICHKPGSEQTPNVFP